MSEDTQQFLVVGEVLKPFGYRGEVKIRVLSDYPNRLLKHKTVYIGPQARAYQVERARLHSPYIVMKFIGFDTDISVAKLRGDLIQIPASAAAPLKKNQYFHHQIIGLTVVTESGDPLGTLAEILETGANDVYIVRTADAKEILLPAIKSVVKKVDLDAKQMTVHLTPGLVEE